jgi:hypothetical protein
LDKGQSNIYGTELLLFHEFGTKWYIAQLNRKSDEGNSNSTSDLYISRTGGGTGRLSQSISKLATNVKKNLGDIETYNTIWEGNNRPGDTDILEAIDKSIDKRMREQYRV